MPADNKATLQWAVGLILALLMGAAGLLWKVSATATTIDLRLAALEKQSVKQEQVQDQMRENLAFIRAGMAGPMKQ